MYNFTNILFTRSWLLFTDIHILKNQNLDIPFSIDKSNIQLGLIVVKKST